MTDLSGFLNLVIAVGCIFVFYACATRAETRLLRLAMFFVLGLMIAERTILGVFRLIDPTGEAVTTSLYVLNPLRFLFALSIFALGAAILKLDRTPKDPPPSAGNSRQDTEVSSSIADEIYQPEDDTGVQGWDDP